MTKTFAACITVIALAAGLFAQGTKTDAKTVTGAWNMSLQGDHVIPVGMELKQDGTKVTGTILMPTQHIGERKEVSLVGECVDGTLTLTGSAEGASPETAKLELTAKLDDDGALAGTLSNGKHSAQWTAERLKRRR